jgi:tetratricopeptide (TPR) repeat protein
MALRRINPLGIAAIAAAFLAGLLAFGLLARSGGPAAGGAQSAAGPGPGDVRSTDARIATLQAEVRAHPGDTGSAALLADAYLQKVRETGDAGFYTRAGGVLAIAHRRDPRSSAVATGLATLALARHDFRAGLRFGIEAHRLAPAVVRPLGVVVDAQVELGRYGEAARTLQRMVDEKPNLASYSRVSYFRELHGDLGGALRAMRLAVAAGGDAPENVAYVQSLLGDLELQLGHVGAAGMAYRRALYEFPGYAAADAGLARVDAARGRLGAAIARMRDVVARLPLPQYVIALGEDELAAGRRGAALRDLALVGAERRLLASAGVNTDAEIALYEADHGSPRRAAALGRRAYAAAPSVRSADALGWALTAAGRPAEGLSYARRALRLGSRDALFLYHAGTAARGAGRTAEARRYLTRALALNPRFSPLYAPRAQRALRSLP